MRMEILGTGCAKCRALEENTRTAAENLGLEFEIEKVTSLAEIVRRGVMMTPALIVDGDLLSMGKALSPAEAEKLLSSRVPAS